MAILGPSVAMRCHSLEHVSKGLRYEKNVHYVKLGQISRNQ